MTELFWPYALQLQSETLDLLTIAETRTARLLLVGAATKLDLFDLQLLISVVETGSLGRTAAKHYLSQPAVSARITSLERALGLRLVSRDQSGTRVTEDGQLILPAARRVLEEAERLFVSARQVREGRASKLTVAASLTVAEYLVPAWAAALRSGAPDAALVFEVLNSAGVLEAVADRRVDVGFVEGPRRSRSGLRSETITTDTLIVVVGARHPWARRSGPLSPDQLAATELIVRERGSGTREVLETALASWGGIRSRLELGSASAVLAAARRGDGPAVVSTLAAAGDLASGQLRLVPVAGLDLRRTIRAVWSADGGLSPLARRLLEVARVSAR